MPDLSNDTLNTSLIPTKVASQLSGYHADYLARLCREKKIIATQIGRSWFIDRESLSSFVALQENRNRERATTIAQTREEEYRLAQKVVSPDVRERLSHIRTLLSKRTSVLSTPSHSVMTRPSLALALSLIVVAGTAYASTESDIQGVVSFATQQIVAVAIRTSTSLPSHGDLRITEVTPTPKKQIPHLAIPSALKVSRAFAYAGGSDGTTTTKVFADEARTASVSEDWITTGRERVALMQSMMTDPSTTVKKIGTTTKSSYLGMGSSVYKILSRLPDTYLAGLQHVGDNTLATASVARDVTMRAPSLTDGILNWYTNGIDAWNDAAPKIAGTIITGTYDLGNSLANVSGSSSRGAVEVAKNIPTNVPASLQDTYLGTVGHVAEGVSNTYQHAVNAETSVALVPVRAEGTMLGVLGYAQTVAEDMATASEASDTDSKVTASVVSFSPISWQRVIEHMLVGSSRLTYAFFTSGLRSLASLVPSNPVTTPALTALPLGAKEVLALPTPADSLTQPTGDSEENFGGDRVVIAYPTTVENYYPQVFTGGTLDDSILDLVRPFIQKSIDSALGNISSNSGSETIVVQQSSGGGGGGISSDGATLTNVTIASGNATLTSLIAQTATIGTLTANIFTASTSSLGNATATTLTAGTTTLGQTTLGTSTVNGSLNVTGTLTAGTFTVNNLSSNNAVVAPYFTATSTNATSTFPNVAVTNLAVENAQLTNATSTNFFSALIRATTGFFDSLSATLATITNLSGTNSSFTNATSTNATTTNSYAVNGTIGSLNATNATSTNLFATNLSATNGVINSLTTTNLGIGSSNFTSLLGTGLLNNGGALSISTSTISGMGSNLNADRLDGLDSTYFLANSFSTSSADAYLATKTSDNLAEGSSNLYFTNSRARSALSSTALGLTYNGATGVFSLTSGYNIPTTASTTAWDSFYQNPSTRIVAGTNLSWSGNTLNGPSDTYIRSLFSASSPLSYNSSTGAFSVSTSTFSGSGSGLNADYLDGLDSTYFLANSYSTSSANYWLSGKSTSNLAEGSNFYFTNARADARVAAGFAGTTTDALAEGSINRYYTDTRARAALSSTIPALTYTSSTGVFSLTSGYTVPLTASTTDWNTAFLNRITSAIAPISITNNAISISQATGSTGGYLSAADFTIFNNKISSSSLSAVGPLTYNSATGAFSLGTVGVANGGTGSTTLTGILLGNGTGALQTLGIGANLTLSGGVLSVATSTFTGSGSGLNADYLDGLDSTYFLANSFSTTSADYYKSQRNFYSTTSADYWLSGKSTSNLAEGSNLYYTNARAQGAISVSGLPLTYSGGIIGINQASGSQAGYISSSDFTTFNGKQSALTFTYPLVNSSNVVSLAFGTSTSNTWGGTQTFTNAPVLGSLTGFLKASAGVLSASLIDLSTDVTSTLQKANGGTGFSSYTAGDILYADNSGNLAKLPVGTAGQVLKVQAGLPSWGVDQTVGGGGSDGIFATSTGKIYPLDTSSTVLIGTNSTSTLNSIFEVNGQQYISSKLGIGTTSPSMPLSVAGNALISGNVNVGSLTLAGNTFTSLLGYGLINSGGQLAVATSTFTGANSNLNADLLDGLDSSYFIANSYSTTSANYWLTTKTTDALTEGSTNKYYTDARARSAFSTTATGLSYNSSTGVLSLTAGYTIPTTASTTAWDSFYQTPSTRITAGTNLSWTGNTLNGPSDTYIRSLFSGTSPIVYNSTTGAISFATSSISGSGSGLNADLLDGLDSTYFLANSFSTSSTDYYKSQRDFFSTTSATALLNTYDKGYFYSTTSANYWLATKTTDNLTEGSTNLYYTNARARAALSTTATGLTYNNSTGVLSLTGGYTIPLTASTTDWNTAYINRITAANAPLSISNNTISISQATLSTNGYLSSTDFNTFNNKISSTSLSATGPLAYNSSTGVFSLGTVGVANGGTGSTTLSGILLGNGTSAVQTLGIGSGLSLAGGTLSLATTSFSGSGSGLNADLLDGLDSTYFLANSFSTTSANYYKSVNNFYSTTSADYWLTTKTTDNLTEGSTNLYYTNARARAAFSTTATGLSYNNSTGVLSLTGGYTIPLTASTTDWNTAYVNRITAANAPLSISNNTISISQATGATNGYLSSTDFNTFNGKISSTSLSATGPLSYNSSTGVFSLGTVGVANGGTGSTTLSGILLGNSTSAVQTLGIGSGLSLAAGTLSLSTTTFSGSGSGFNADLLDGLDSTYFLANSYSTTSANYWLTTKSTTNLAEGTNLYYTDARVNSYIAASTTIPKTYTSNIFSALNTFNGGLTTSGTVTLGSLTGVLHASSGVVSASNVLLGSEVSGTLGVANGGTGSTTLSGILLGNGTSAVQTLGIGSGLALSAGTLSSTVSSSSLALDSQYFRQNGNSFGGLATLGTIDNNALRFITNNAERARFDTAGNFGVGTTTPNYKLSVAGSLGLTGALYDRNYSAGTNGQILQTTGTGIQWVATSSLGFSSASGSTNQVAYYSGTNALTGSSGFTYDGTNLSVGGNITTTAQFVGTGGTGSYSAPTYSFASDLSTGMFHYANNTIGFATGGVPRVLIDGNGYLSVGSSSPSAALSVEGNAIVNGSGAFTQLIDSGLTANTLTYANAGKQLSSVTLGSSLSLSSGTLSVSTSSISGSGSGLNADLLDGLDSTYFLANSYSTSSANYWLTTKNTDNLTEGSTNLYYSNTRARGAISVSGLPLTYNSSTGVIGINQANTSQAGYLSSTDFNTFNGKISSTSLTSGTGISYNSSTGVIANTGLLSLQQLGGGTAQTGAITFATTSTTVNGQTHGLNITNVGGAFTFSPTLSGILSVAGGGTGLGTTPSYGQILVGNGTGYTLTSTSSLGFVTGVSSVFGRTGAVTAQSGDYNTSQVTENTNLYYTDARARSAVSVSGTPLTYNSTTGVFGINQANTSQSGYLSSTDFNTFNGKISSTSLSATGPLAYNSSTGVFSLGTVGVANGGTGSTTLSGILLGNGTSAVQTLGIGSGLSLSSGILSSNISTSSLSLDSQYFRQNGNSFGGLASLGTIDNNALRFITNNTERARFDTAGNFGIGTTSPQEKFAVAGTAAITGTTTLANGNYIINADGTSVVNSLGQTGSFFVGSFAGNSVTNSSYSNFIGSQAGYLATNASYSNFIGLSTGLTATNAYGSNFIGLNAGVAATNASYSIFIGTTAGYNAQNASNSNFFGSATGAFATNASSSNFIGLNAGYSATNAQDSIFIGSNAGYSDTVNNTSGGSSIAIGRYAGTGGYSNSIAVGRGVINNSATQFNIGNVLYGTGIYNSDTQSASPISGGKVGIGTSTPFANLSVAGSFLLTGAFYDKNTSAGTNGYVLQTTGTGVQWVATSSLGISGGGSGSGTVNSGTTGQLPYYAANGTTLTATSSIFLASNGYVGIGTTTPNGALSVQGTTYLGNGNLTIDTNGVLSASPYGNSGSFFAGSAAGLNSSSTYATYVGIGTGAYATNASNSNFLGYFAGSFATNASNSNFLGVNAGASAVNASYTTFIGYNAGYNASSAKNALFLGNYAGYNDTVSNTSGTASTSIAIGQYAGTGGYTDSIAIGHGVINNAAAQFNIGNVLYGTGIYAQDTQSSTALTTGKIGIGTSTPFANLSVAGSFLLTGAFYDKNTSAGTNGYVLQTTGTGVQWVATSSLGISGGGSGSVTSVNASGGTTGLSFSGGPVTSSGTLTLGGTLGVANGGTGSTTLSGILLGNGTSAVSTLGIGSGLTLTSGTLSSSISTSTLSLDTQYFRQNGNSFGSLASLGTIDNNALRFITNNTERARFDTAGNFGIGTSSPTQAVLSVESGSANTNSMLTGSVNGYLQANLQNRNNGSNASSDFVVTNDIGTASSYYADFGINSSGNTDPSYTLFGANEAYLYNNDAGISIGTASSSATAALKFFTGGTLAANERARITSAGNFGIGTTSPFANLSVAGSFLLTGAFYDKNTSAGTNGYILQTTGTGVQWVATSTLGLGGSGGGSVTSVDASGGTTGLTFSGGPITSTGTLTLAGKLGIANGGTNTTTFTTGQPVYYNGTSLVSTSTLTVNVGGTGATTLTANGVLYGAGTGAIVATAQGPANSILTANAGAPSFSAAPTIGTSVTTPIIYGGNAVTSTLTLRGYNSTQPTTAAVVFGAGTGAEIGRVNSLGFGIGTTTPQWNLTISSSTKPQLVLTDGTATSNGWAFRNAGGNLYLATTSPTTFATSSVSALTINTNGYVGIATTSPYTTLAVGGQVGADYFTASSQTSSSTLNNLVTTNLRVSGRFYDVNNSAGTNGYVLQTTGTGVQWVATSSLGISGGGGSGSGTVNSGTTGQLPYYAANGTTLTATSSIFLASNGYVGIGSTSPSAKLSVAGTAAISGTATFANGNFVVNSDGSLVANSAGVSGALFAGSGAGNSATSATNANFVGPNAGYGATNADNSNFFGNNAGNGATGANASNFFGQSAGNGATGASASNFFGYSAGYGASNAPYSNFFGFQAGVFATNAYDSNFFGFQAGISATNASRSNFFGDGSGNSATNASGSNFFGYTAGYGASSGDASNFFGQAAGYNATNASNSNFFGINAGYNATGGTYSNFIGSGAGYNATNGYSSSFIGYNAGSSATNARDSIFIGTYAGFNDTVNNSFNTNTSIAIGRYAGTGGYSDSIALGRGVVNSATQQLNIGNVLYGTSIYNSDATTSTPVSGGRIGIGTSTPTAQLHTTGTVRFSNFGAGTLTTDASGNLSVSSDERLKDINGSFSRGLADLQKLSPILYHWNTLSGLDKESQYAGFSAQNVFSAIPEAIDTDPRGYLTLQDRPIIAASVNAIKELAGRTDLLSTTTSSLGARLGLIEQQNAAVAMVTPMPQALTASSITATTMAIAQGVSAGTFTTQTATVGGTVSAARYIVPATAQSFTMGSTSISAALPSEVLTDGGNVDMYKMASYGIALSQSLASRTELLTLRIDDIETRIAALEAMNQASSTDATSDTGSTASGMLGLATDTVQHILASFGIMVSEGLAQFKTVIMHQLVLDRGADGTSAAGSETIAVGQTTVIVENALVLPTSKVFITFTSSVDGAWYISEKKEGSFTVTFAKPQGTPVSFDYFLVQTEGQYAGAASANPQTPATTPTTPTGSSTPNTNGDPTVSLIGDAAMTLVQGAAWTDPGATAVDAQGADITSSIAVSGGVDTNTAGVYTVTYRATDGAGKYAEVSRVVMVIAPNAGTTASGSGSDGSSGGSVSAGDGGSLSS